jgi:hypothetical protein
MVFSKRLDSPRDAQRDAIPEQEKSSCRNEGKGYVLININTERSVSKNIIGEGEEGSLVDQQLGGFEERKSIRTGKCCGKAMDSDGQRSSSRRVRIASKTLKPTESPMSALGSRHHLLGGHCHRLLRGCGFHRHHHGLGADHFEPVASDVATWPIVPQHRQTRGWRLWGDQRCRGKHLVRRDRPKNGADLSWLSRGGGFLTLRAKRTRTAMAEASPIDNAQRAIALRSALLHG